MAQAVSHHRRILSDLGYPQPPTLLRMDNTVALGLASGTMNAKRSKSMDMRFFWLVDRVEQQTAAVRRGSYSRSMEHCRPFHKSSTEIKVQSILTVHHCQHGQRDFRT